VFIVSGITTEMQDYFFSADDGSVLSTQAHGRSQQIALFGENRA
jgi:hypothetical protein